MSDEIKSDQNNDVASQGGVASRRRLLKLGAASVPVIVSMRGGSALAQTQISMGLSNCTVSIPLDVVQGIEGAGATTGRTFNADEIAAIIDGDGMTSVTMFDTEYASYLETMTLAGSGLSCVASIQMAVMTPPNP